MISKKSVIFIFSLAACFAPVSTATAAIKAGDILAAVNLDGQGGGVVKIDPLTGDRILVSGFGVGSGPSEFRFSNITADNRGNIYVTTEPSDFLDNAKIIRIDSATGDRTILSSDSIGTGLPLGNPGIEWLDGKLIAGGSRILEVDPVSGDRELISSALAPARGSGDPVRAFGLAVDVSGQILATDVVIAAVVGIDPTTGDRSLISQDMGRGDGPEFSAPTGIVVDPTDGSIYVSDIERGRISRVDPDTGDRTGIVDSPLLFPFDLGQMESGELLTIDRWSGEKVIAVDPETGSIRTISTLVSGILSNDVGAGPIFFSAGGLFVVGSLIPEPTAAVLFVMLVPLVGRARFRRR